MGLGDLFGEAEETRHSPQLTKKPKERVKTENDEDISLKVTGQAGSVVQFKIKRHFYTT